VSDGADRSDDLDIEDFTNWYRRGAPRLVAILAMDTGDVALARDVADEACTRLYERWDRDRPERPDAWIVAVAFNLLRRHRRRAATERAALARLGHPDPVPGPTLTLDVDLERAIRALPPRMRRATLLRYVAGLGEAEVADAMGVRTGTASAHLAEARARLAVALQQPWSAESFVSH
jgi:RNA polymerase sigma-70 factor (ECF subfamily)